MKYSIIILDQNESQDVGGAYLPFRMFASSPNDFEKVFYWHQSRLHKADRLIIEEDIENFLGCDFVNEFNEYKFTEFKAEENKIFLEKFAMISQISK